MDFFCEICLKNIKAKNKYEHSKSTSHIEFDKCKHILLSLKDNDINGVDKAFYEYKIEHYKKTEYHLIKCQFKLFFNDYQYCPCVTSILLDNKTKKPWSNVLEEKFVILKIKDILSII